MFLEPRRLVAATAKLAIGSGLATGCSQGSPAHAGYFYREMRGTAWLLNRFIDDGKLGHKITRLFAAAV